jgi:tetratricopeptide (TPR) repeat protein
VRCLHRQLLLISFALVSIAPGMAADLTPEAAYALVARAPWSGEARPKPEEVAAARNVIEAQAKREPGAAKWAYAMAHVARLEGEQASGDAAEKKRRQALEGFGKATEMQPRNAEYQFWFATASFDRVDDVNMLSKMSLATDGRKAYEKAIEIDPAYVPARVGLAQFYIGAPSIAGGSIEKAKVQGEALLKLADQRGEFQGDMLLAGIAAQEKNWAEMSRWYALAETAHGEGADLVVALRSHAWQLLNRKKDPQAAAPVVERYMKVAPADDMTALYLDGEVKRLLGRCAEALVAYDRVLAKFAQARGSRWGAAVCRDQLGQKDAARKDYEEYAKRFPDDDRANEAKAAIKRLSGS